jgi:hypothetical protein
MGVGVAVLFPVLLVATPGIFRGTLVNGPKTEAGWVFLLGANRSLRRVEIRRAQVVYGASVLERDRNSAPERSLREGVEVRVTAEQDEAGDWHATRIEILRLQAPSASTLPRAGK